MAKETSKIYYYQFEGQLTPEKSEILRDEILSMQFVTEAKIEYKARLNGVKVIAVNPKYSSQQCSKCAHISKSNRRSQSEFECQACGFKANADFNASRNLRERATVKLPNDIKYQGSRNLTF